jgi:hypothetical protein
MEASWQSDAYAAMHSSCAADVSVGSKAERKGRTGMSALPPIVLQKSKVAAPRNFRENKKRETTTDSYALNRAAEVTGEFNVRGSVRSHLYTKDAPTTRRIFDHLCKTTFATQSLQLPTRQCCGSTSAVGYEQTLGF